MQTYDRIKCGDANNDLLENALLNVYAKCGDFAQAEDLFNNIYVNRGSPNVNVWNTMINACAKHRLGKKAVDFFETMVGSDVTPDATSFVVLFNACSHANMADLALQYYGRMQKQYSIIRDFSWLEVFFHY